MRIAITGGTGFLGAHLARTLTAAGHTVACLDVTPSSPLLEGCDGLRMVTCDVGWWAELSDALRDLRPQVIYHTAGILSAQAEKRPLAAYRANATGTFNLLEAARALGAKVLFTSTIATYGPGAPPTVDETTRQRPQTIYGATKVFCELLGEYYARRFGLDFRALRLPAVIGPGRGTGGASAYSSLIVSEPARGRRFEVPVSEDVRMPVVYVKDAVAALLELERADPSTLRRRTYGIAGFSPTAGELAAAVRGALPSADIVFVPDPDTERIVRSWPDRVDASEAAADWGWKEGYDLDAAVADFVEEISRHPEWP